MDAQIEDKSHELILEFMLALSLQSAFQSNLSNRILKDYIDSGCSFSIIEPLIKRISKNSLKQAQVLLEAARSRGVEVLCPFSPQYPSCLRDIPDPPAAIFIRGRIESSFNVAVVGSRRGSERGRRFAYELGRGVVEAGGTLVSGLALGIDAAAHLGAISVLSPAGQVPTIAVLGSGVCKPTPVSNAFIAEDLLHKGGAIVSEYGLDRMARSYHFPRRNRIISALSQRVVVVEATARSGALITARLALEQGKEVAAVPGAIENRLCAGTNALIKDGAQVVTSIQDVLDGLSRKRISNPKTPSTEIAKHKIESLELGPLRTGLAHSIVEILSEGQECDFDVLLDKTAIMAQELNALLSTLEISGIVHRSRNQDYILGEAIDI